MSSSAKILLVDDDLVIQKLLNIYLQRMGYKVFIAENGKKACQIFEEQAFDLILLDTMMPVMDGFSFLRYLRQEKQDMTPVLSLTGMENKNSRQILLDAGASDVLFKPVKIDALKEKINVLLSTDK